MSKLRIILLICLVQPASLSYGQSVTSGLSDSVFLKSIIIEGKRNTKDAVVLRELSVRAGTMLPAENMELMLRQNELRLMSMALFNKAALTWDTLSRDTVSLNIELIDRFPIFPEGNIEFVDRYFNVWWKEQNFDLSRINLGLTLHHNNFRGNGEVISVTGQLGYTPMAGLSYSRPFAGKGQKLGYGVSIFGLQNREIGYQTRYNKIDFHRDDDNFMLRRFELGGMLRYRPVYSSTYSLELKYFHYWISKTIAGLNPEYLGDGRTEDNILQFRFRYQWNEVDNWNYPLEGRRFIGILEQNVMLNGKNSQTSLSIQADQYINPFPYWYGSLILRARWSFPYQQAYLFRKNLGYDYHYLRGFEYYVIDGPAFGLIRGNVKRMLLDKKIHLPIRYFEVIPIRILAKVYGDVGFSYNPNQAYDLLNNKILYSYGFGIDIITLYDIKLRIEYTFNSLREKGLFLHKSGE